MVVTYMTVGNGKLMALCDEGRIVIGWGIPASDTTCPNADECKFGCYAKSGRYLFANVKAKLDARYKLAESEDFVTTINGEISEIKTKNPSKQVYVRIHDSGDFYSPEYVAKWFAIMRDNPEIKFYAYTKMVTMFLGLESAGRIPDNFHIVYSYGGTEDNLIPADKPHAKVFESKEDLLAAGYVDCSKDDLLVYTTAKIGLVYHGNRKWENTGFINIE